MDISCKEIQTLLVKNLLKQRGEDILCDVSLKSGDKIIKAHSCVLATGSVFFQKLFCGHFSDKPETTVELPLENPNLTEKVIEFLYTGTIQINSNDIEEVLLLSDYLCIESLRKFSSDALGKEISLKNCLHLWLLAVRYHLIDLKSTVLKFITPKLSVVTKYPEFLYLEFMDLLCFLKEPEFSVMKESEKLNCIIEWIKHDPQERLKHLKIINEHLSPKYFSVKYLQGLLRNEYLILSSDECFINACKGTLDRLLGRGDEHYIICRTRVTSHGTNADLLAYNVINDEWHQIKTPSPNFADQVVAITVHGGDLCFLLNKTEDVYGYMHPMIEHKELWLLDYTDGQWHQMSSTQGLPGMTRIFSHKSGLYALDQHGAMALYKFETNTWHMVGQQGFEASRNTWYTVPMPIDDKIYVLRAFSLGYSYQSGELGFSLHVFDTLTHVWEHLSDIHASELQLGDKERIHGYIIQPGYILLRDECGTMRAKFDIVEKTWSSFTQEERIPAFVKDLWGTVGYLDTIYWIGRTDENESVFMLYDCSENKVKIVSQPEFHLSGIACHFRISGGIAEKTLQTL